MMTRYASDHYHRRSIRLRGYDYSQAGSYFITICTQNKECLLGEIVEGEMCLNEAGKIIASEWVKITALHDEIELDEWVVMPNHFHGIVVFATSVGAIHESPLRMTMKQRRNMAIPKWVGRFKMLTAKQINQLRRTPGSPVWQRNYYEHIIRDELSLQRIREYIVANPARWAEDSENPKNVGRVGVGMTDVGAIHDRDVGMTHDQDVGAIHDRDVGAIHDRDVGMIHDRDVGAIHESPLRMVRRHP